MPVPELLYNIAVWAPPVLFAITLHEVAHGWVANKLGDPTAKNRGRLTVNPLKHVDPMGTIIVPFFMYMVSPFILGWAKPVPVEPRYFKAPMLDMALVAAAGPVSNFVMACLWAGFIKLCLLLMEPSPILFFFVMMGKGGILINIILMMINLVPVPPLDGGRVVAGIMPEWMALQFMRIEPFGMIIIIVLLVSGILGQVLWPQVVQFQQMIGYLFGLKI